MLYLVKQRLRWSHIRNLKNEGIAMPTALISVSDKSGIAEFAKELIGLGWDLLASSGTVKFLGEHGITARDVAEIVGGGPILGHRVVTLSREIHAGLLARESDAEELEKLGIPWIHLFCSNLYPLAEEIARPDATEESVIEKTDIGGPALLRSAAKGRRIVICYPSDRDPVISWLKNGQPGEKAFLRELAAKAERVAAEYSLDSARFTSWGRADGFIGEVRASCQYGENKWQKPADLLAPQRCQDPLAIHNFHLVAGAERSFNNFCDLDRALQTATHIAEAFRLNRGRVPRLAVAVKHGNACGAAVGEDVGLVLPRAVMGDPRAVMGALVLANFPIEEHEADILLHYGIADGQRRLLDAVVAPGFTDSAVEMLKRKAGKCRLMANRSLGDLTLDRVPRFRQVRGGFLRQPNYTFVLDLADPELTFGGREFGDLSEREANPLLLAWAVAATSNSNTISIVDGDPATPSLIGNGVGQQDRVGCCELAIKRAKDAGHSAELAGAVAASDSFFPFVDGPSALAAAGIKTILATSGSVNDDNVRDSCYGHGVTLCLIPDAKARGFFGH